MNIIEILEDKIQGKAPKGARRSPEWRRVRKEHLRKYPRCTVCGSRTRLRVHHIIPFHIAPHLELDPNNLTTLCENKKYGVNCHLLFGHLGNFRRTNPSCEIDIVTWAIKLNKVDRKDWSNVVFMPSPTT